MDDLNGNDSNSDVDVDLDTIQILQPVNDILDSGSTDEENQDYKEPTRISTARGRRTMGT